MGYFNFIKFDKLYKIVIAFTFIVVSMFSIFNCFCFASTPLSINIVRNLYYDGKEFVNHENASVGYYDLVVGHEYTVRNNYATAGRLLRFTDEVPAPGVTVSTYDSISLPAQTETTFVATYDKLFIFDVGTNLTTTFDTFEVYDNTVGFDSAITDLFYNVGISQLWSVFNTSVPYVLIVVVIAFGIYLITRMIKGLSKGKGRL